MAKTLLEFEDNLATVKKCRASGSEAFLVPALPGRQVELMYLDGKLDTSGMGVKKLRVIQESEVPRNIYGANDKWGGVRIDKLIVVCKFNDVKLIAIDALTEEGAIHNRITTLNLLHQRRFITPMRLCSWLPVHEAPDRKTCEKWVKKRLREVNEVIEGKRSTLFETGANVSQSDISWFGKVENVHIIDAINFRPQVANRKIQSVYK